MRSSVAGQQEGEKPLQLLTFHSVFILSLQPAASFSHSSLLTVHCLLLTYFSPALRNAAICRSNTAGSLIGMRCLCTASEKFGLSRSTSAVSARASASLSSSL